MPDNDHPSLKIALAGLSGWSYVRVSIVGSCCWHVQQQRGAVLTLQTVTPSPLTHPDMTCVADWVLKMVHLSIQCIHLSQERIGRGSLLNHTLCPHNNPIDQESELIYLSPLTLKWVKNIQPNPFQSDSSQNQCVNLVLLVLNTWFCWCKRIRAKESHTSLWIWCQCVLQVNLPSGAVRFSLTTASTGASEAERIFAQYRIFPRQNSSPCRHIEPGSSLGWLCFRSMCQCLYLWHLSWCWNTAIWVAALTNFQKSVRQTST